MKAFILGSLMLFATALFAGNGDKPEMKIYPNPASKGDVVHITVSQDDWIDLEIIDITGKIIKVPYTVRGDGSIELDVSGCTFGIYYVKIKTPKGNTVTKLVVN